MNMNKLKLGVDIQGISSKTVEDAVLELKGLNDTTEGKVASLQTSITDALTKTEAAAFVKGIAYDAATCKFTFTMYDNSTQEVDLPLESTVKTGRYDSTNKKIILVLNDTAETEIEIPVGDLVDTYTGEDGTQVKVEVATGNIIKASIKAKAISSTELSDTLNTKLGEIDTISGDLDDVKSDVGDLKTDNTTNKSDITTLKTNDTSKGTAITDLQGRMTTAEGKVTTLEGKMSTAETDISDIKVAVGLEAGSGSGSSITEDVSDLKDDVSDIDKILNGDTDTNTKGIVEKVGDLETDNTTNKSNISTLQSDVGDLKTDNTTNKSDISTLKTDMTTAKSDITTLQSDVAAIPVFKAYATGQQYKQGTPIYIIRETGDLVYLTVASKDFTASTFDADIANKNIIRVGIPNEYYDDGNNE